MLEYYIFDSKISDSSLFSFLFSIVLISNYYIDKKYDTFKEMFLIFFFSLFILFSVNTFIFKSYAYAADTGSVSWIDYDKTVEFLLVRPLTSLLTLLNYNVFYDDTRIFFEDLSINQINSIGIAYSCSGVYSIIIFSSFFFAYIVSMNHSLDITKVLFFIFVILCSYWANIIRMSLIIIVGHYYGVDYLLLTHHYLGSIIFTVQLLLYFLVFEYITGSHNVLEKR